VQLLHTRVACLVYSACADTSTIVCEHYEHLLGAIGTINERLTSILDVDDDELLHVTTVDALLKCALSILDRLLLARDVMDKQAKTLMTKCLKFISGMNVSSSLTGVCVFILSLIIRTV
jgi:hypothetical protein